MVKLGRALSIAVVALAIISISALLYSQLVITKNSYNSSVQVSFHKSNGAYDYSCEEADYQIYFVIKNTGSKNVTDLSVSVTNPLCVGAIPALPKTLTASSSIDFYVQSASQNGTLTISGNNTLVLVKF